MEISLVRTKFFTFIVIDFCAACVNGSIGYVAPISEPEYRRLQDMSTEMMNRLDQPAGLNPRAFR